MDRRALVLYLENVRDLEVIKNRINQIWSEKKEQYQMDVDNHPTVVEPSQIQEIPDYSSAVAYVVGGVVVLALDVWLFTKPAHNDWFSMLCKLVICGVLVIIALVLFMMAKEKIEDRKHIIEFNKFEEVRVKEHLKLSKKNKEYLAKRKNEWKKTDQFCRQQYDQADEILTKFYNMNIIPVQYRKLSAVCFLYDYMNTSQESFQMALLSNHIEDGIRRIEARLNEIIERLDEIIWQQRVIQEENRQYVNRQIEQNNRMIDSLKRMEIQQENIEEYSRLSANYNEAQAFISMAYYMKHS